MHWNPQGKNLKIFTIEVHIENPKQKTSGKINRKVQFPQTGLGRLDHTNRGRLSLESPPPGSAIGADWKIKNKFSDSSIQDSIPRVDKHGLVTIRISKF
jgi:hypothetical protein